MKKFRKLDPRRNNSQKGPPKGRVVVGIHAVLELLKVRPGSVTDLWLKTGFADNESLNQISQKALSARVKVEAQSPQRLDEIVASHQGVVAFSSSEPELNWELLKSKDRSTVIVLDEVEDPHNLGAVLRTAWLQGVDAVFTSDRRAASASGVVSKVAQGAVEHVPVISSVSLVSELEQLKADGFWIFGMSHKAQKSLFSLKLPEKVAWVLGSEATGLRKPIEKACDELIALPQTHAEASYNVSVAAAMALTETHRQRLSVP